MMHKIFSVFFIGVVMLTLSGCIGQQAFTKMARKGDTVTLALGGSPRHEINGYVDKNNMQVKITDSAGMTYDANLRYLLRLYSDPTNRYNYNSTYVSNTPSNWMSRNYIEPNQGLWVAVVDLTYPNTATPLPLAEGPASFQVITPDLVETRQIWPSGIPKTDGYLSQIPIEILPGTGSIHNFNDYGDPIDLEPLPQMQISFDNSALTTPYPDNTTKIGAIQFKVTYSKTYFNNDNCPPMIRGNINDPRINVLVKSSPTLGEYTVFVFAPFGGVLANNDPGNAYLKAKLKDMKIFVVWDPVFVNGSIDETNYNQIFQFSEYKIIDLNGAPLNDGNGAPLVTILSQLHMH